MINAAIRRTGTARKLIRKIGNAITNKKEHAITSPTYLNIKISRFP